MRVLYLLDSLRGGGTETSVIEMLPALRERGVEPVLFTLLRHDDALASRVHELGIEFRRFDTHSWPRGLRELHGMLKHGEFDVMHTALIWSDLIGRALAVGTDIAVVTSLVNSSYGPEHRANSKYGPLAVRALQGLDALASRRTNVFHAISHEIAALMTRRLHLRPDRIEVVYRGRDPERLGSRTPERRVTTRAKLGIGADVPLVLCVARLDRQKAVDVALRALEIVRRSLPQAQMVVAGRNGNDGARLQAIAGSMQGVRLLGHRSDVADLMCAADCLCFPSRWEGLGGTLIEALALEVPIVASDIGPIRELLDGVGWPLAAVDDPNAFADGIQAVLTNRVPVTSLAEHGKARFDSHFTMAAIADEMVGLYARAIDKARP